MKWNAVHYLYLVLLHKSSITIVITVRDSMFEAYRQLICRNKMWRNNGDSIET